MAYATAQLLYEYLPDLASQPDTHTTVEHILDRATAYIDRRLGFSYNTATTDSRVVYGDGSDYLVLPPDYVAGSLTSVTTISTAILPQYVEQDRHLVVTRGGIAAHRLAIGVSTPSFNNNQNYMLDAWVFGIGWQEGVPYTVAATYGYGTVPDDIVECCLELTVRMWRGKDAGFSDVVGVEGRDAVGYNGAEPAFVKKILNDHSIYTSRNTVGVW